MISTFNFPRQQLSISQKGKKWRKQCIDWCDNKTYLGSELVRKSVKHKMLNYDLLNGKLHMDDLMLVLNPDSIITKYIPDNIQHHAIINSKLNVLRGEERNRVFDSKVIITNPDAVSEIENTKKDEIFSRIQEMVQNEAQSEEEFIKELERMNNYYKYDYQDLREIRANYLLNHYSKEYNFPNLFNTGFMDAMAVGEEIYQCDIEHGEPVIRKLNPLKVRIFRSGYSNKIEDADIIILEDYWAPGKVIDTFYDSLTQKDIKYLDDISTDRSTTEGKGFDDDRNGMFLSDEYHEYNGDIKDLFFSPELSYSGVYSLYNSSPYDIDGNVRVLRMYWKSKRKIKKVKQYDPLTGTVDYHFYNENYIIDKYKGEEEEIFWVNEAWEGTKIGDDIYVNIRPRPVRYQRMRNPSLCHFGIIGTIYNLNDDRPFSLVDIMKPYNYLYDVIWDRLNKLIARNKGKVVLMDLAKVPKGWEAEKWIYYLTVNGVAVVDSFKEGNIGAATGKLAGGLNNASTGVIDAEWGNNIQQYINLLQFIKLEMGEVAGISPQREGQVANRETVGGVERATLQSSHITEWIFSLHEDLKKRVLECFIETAKVAMKGRNKKFQYILPDYSSQMVEIDGDEFSENDYGLVVDNSRASQELNSKIETLAQAALQNQALTFSTIMKLYSSASIAEKQRMVEQSEQEMQQRAEQAQQQQLQQQQQIAEMQQQTAMQEMQFKDTINQRDNDTKILVAEINSQAEAERLAMMNNDADMDGIRDDEIRVEDRADAKEKLMEQMREFDERLALDKKKVKLQEEKQRTDARLKEKQINKQSKSSKN